MGVSSNFIDAGILFYKVETEEATNSPLLKKTGIEE